MALVRTYISKGLTRSQALHIAGITKHQYYHQARTGKRGRPPSVQTPRIITDGTIVNVDNEQVVQAILTIKSDPETDYGYSKMTAALMHKSYIINRKKVYRLMRAYQLLHEVAPKPSRKYVRYRRVNPTRPLEVLEIDLKFQWVVQHQCYAYILTILDCFTRKALYWKAAYSIKKHNVKEAWEYVIVHYLQPYNTLGREIKVEVRNDNDKRFLARMVRDYLEENQINHVFTHPYAPQENGHIESFHSILGRSLDRHDYLTLWDLNKHLEHFYQTYNEVRLHGSLDHLSPNQFWQLWEQGHIEASPRPHKPTRFQLKFPHYYLSGNGSLREHLFRP